MKHMCIAIPLRLAVLQRTPPLRNGESAHLHRRAHPLRVGRERLQCAVAEQKGIREAAHGQIGPLLHARPAAARRQIEKE
eukprot:2501845-Pleurochrysis_carterae.AAC.3